MNDLSKINQTLEVLYLALRSVKRTKPSIISGVFRAISKDISSLTEVNDTLENMELGGHILSDYDWERALNILHEHESSGIRVITLKDILYPQSLRVIKDAPTAIFLKGNVETLTNIPGMAIVGTRKASSNGKAIARRVSEFLSECGWTIVSGLALGIDAEAHRGCLNKNGETIAVLAGGLDKPTPASNSKLGYEILDKGGAWLSEHPLGVPTKREFFVPRNRIQIGLSVGSLIVEAEIKSGSTSQANFCTGQGRALFAIVPHEDNNPLKLNCAGTQDLVKNKGAIPIRTRGDYERLLKVMNSHLEELGGKVSQD
ncbi:hypothetical protein GCM10009123_09200 [Kangiella japonica]|uniref:Smf/DprA SLOG domain-containing protein n=1 Tax=Kangiella japonica TaxID=647384 RepID=A0ABP3CGH7_9GAMM